MVEDNQNLTIFYLGPLNDLKKTIKLIVNMSKLQFITLEKTNKYVTQRLKKNIDKKSGRTGVEIELQRTSLSS